MRSSYGRRLQTTFGVDEPVLYWFQTYLSLGAIIFIYLFFSYKLRTQCHTIKAETVQNNNRHWRRPTQVLKHLRVALKHKHTRSQAVARIADRTAKNCRGHVTDLGHAYFQEKLFVRLLCITHTKLHTTFKVCSSSSFGCSIVCQKL